MRVRVWCWYLNSGPCSVQFRNGVSCAPWKKDAQAWGRRLSAPNNRKGGALLSNFRDKMGKRKHTHVWLCKTTGQTCTGACRSLTAAGPTEATRTLTLIPIYTHVHTCTHYSHIQTHPHYIHIYTRVLTHTHPLACLLACLKISLPQLKSAHTLTYKFHFWEGVLGENLGCTPRLSFKKAAGSTACHSRVSNNFNSDAKWGDPILC